MVYVYSCYAQPSLTLSEFEEMFDNLVLDERGRSLKVIAGDFNPFRGRCLLEIFAQMDIVLANEGVDLTFVSLALARGMSYCVSEFYTHSGHHEIFLDLSYPKPGKITGWSPKALDEQIFLEVWLDQPDKTCAFPERAVHVAQCIAKAFNAPMHRRWSFSSRRLLVES